VARASRTKGLVGEREVAAVWRSAGLEVRNLEGQGDNLVIAAALYATPDDVVPWRDEVLVHCETKRAERLKLPEWLRQAKAEAPPGAVPVVAFRQNRGEWYAALPLALLAALVAGNRRDT
jgi:hypothetical protein